MTTTYDKVIQLANTLQAEGKYDSTYSAVLAIYQELTGDTNTKFDSTYSIVATIADGCGDIDLGGGGSESGSSYSEYLTPKVRFYNYKGEIVETWTLEEAKTKTELPAFNDELVEFANGEYTDLRQEGWNWDLADIQSAQTDISVGALYRPYDGKTYIELHIGKENLNTRLYYRIFSNGIVDWGDGTTSNYSDTNGSYLQHTYEVEGDYVVKIEGGQVEASWMSLYAGYEYLGVEASYYFGQVLSIFFGSQINTFYLEYLYNLKYVTFTNDTVSHGATNAGTFKIQYTSSLNHVTLPKGINYLYAYAFNNSGIKSISLPKLSNLGSCNFNYCPNLKLIAVPYTTSELSSKLNYCASLETVLGIENLSDPNTSFESSPNIKFLKSKIRKGTGYCFSKVHLHDYYYTGTLEEFLNKSGISVGSYVPNNQCVNFYVNNKKLVDVTIPNSITEICGYAFAHINSLKSVHIPSHVNLINAGAFYNSSVENVIINGNITEIPARCFNTCYNLSSITIPDSVTTIGMQSFQECIKLTNVVMPASLTYIDSYAFRDIYGLIVDCTKCTQVPELSHVQAFSGMMTILVPSALYDEWVAATNWSSIASKIVAV